MVAPPSGPITCCHCIAHASAQAALAYPAQLTYDVVPWPQRTTVSPDVTLCAGRHEHSVTNSDCLHSAWCGRLNMPGRSGNPNAEGTDTMPTSVELRQERAWIGEQMRAITETAEAENRNLDATEGELQSLLETLIQLTAQFAAWANSAEGQAQLAAAGVGAAGTVGVCTCGCRGREMAGKGVSAKASDRLVLPVTPGEGATSSISPSRRAACSLTPRNIPLRVAGHRRRITPDTRSTLSRPKT